ncbi:MAG: hypothetical protein QOI01_5093 [Mycobacterium sp.]|jgi:hypothetical protein|nr:hypothetical protein [Mycobacterium sp.]
MIDLKTIAGGIAVAGTLGLAALGIGSGVANAAPSQTAPETTWAQDGGGHGHGGGGDWHGDGDGWRGPRWAPPPPYYGYGGYGGPCVTGPLGFVQVCA